MIARSLWIALAALAAAPGGGSPVRHLAQGQQSGVDRPRQLVARSRREWEALVGDYRGSRENKQGALALHVDWSKEMLLAAFMGQKPTGGYSVTITSVRSVGGHLFVTVAESVPSRDVMTAQVLTTPFDIVAVKKSALPVVWKTISAPAARPLQIRPGAGPQ